MRDSARSRREGLTPGPDRLQLTLLLERYLLQSVIGSGSMGVVHRAFDTVLGRTVAIKTIREELVARNPLYRTYRSRFWREASISGSLSHPGIVTVYDVGETEEGIPFLAMEYVQGFSLAELLARGERLTLDQAMWLLAQVASAIDYAHGEGVVHRDIKPSNILVRAGEEAKIADFGVAKVLGSEFTRTQTLFGTPGYMSPEQVVGGTLTESTDIFSLAVVAFELFSGRRPFPGKKVHTVLHRLVHAEPILPENLERLGLVTEKWKEVFGKALAKDPAKRYETASAFVSELVELFPGSWLGHLISGGTNGEAEDERASREPSPETLTLRPSRRRPS